MALPGAALETPPPSTSPGMRSHEGRPSRGCPTAGVWKLQGWTSRLLDLCRGQCRRAIVSVGATPDEDLGGGRGNQETGVGGTFCRLWAFLVEMERSLRGCLPLPLLAAVAGRSKWRSGCGSPPEAQEGPTDKQGLPALGVVSSSLPTWTLWV